MDVRPPLLPSRARPFESPLTIGLFAVLPLWALVMTLTGAWAALPSAWPAAATMTVGSFLAGATAEGGGAVAFPVFTLVLGIAPSTARDFALMCQSIGMGSAALTILLSRTPWSRDMVLFPLLGSMIGTPLGARVIGPMLTPPVTKLFFVSLWVAMGVALWHTSRVRGARASIFRAHGSVRWELLAVGVAGGVVSGLVGTGLDLLTFAWVVLRYRLSETIATPSSVVLMAANSWMGSLFLAATGPGLAPQAWHLLSAAAPVVCLFAPLGAWFIRGKDPAYVRAILLGSIAAQYVGAVLILPMTPERWALSAATILGGAGAWTWLASRSGAPSPPSAG